jgi:hypothetical protein
VLEPSDEATRLGGGVLGNDSARIILAIEGALARVAGQGLKVVTVSR